MLFLPKGRDGRDGRFEKLFSGLCGREGTVLIKNHSYKVNRTKIFKNIPFFIIYKNS